MSQPNLAHTLYFRWLDQQRQDKLAQQSLEAAQAQQLGGQIRKDTDDQQALQRQTDAKSQLAGAVEAYDHGNESKLMQLNPELGLKFRKENNEEMMNNERSAKLRSDLDLSKLKMTTEREQKTARAQKAWDTATPAERERMRATFAGMAANNLLDMPKDNASGASAEAVFDPLKPTSDEQEYEYSLKNPDFLKYQREMANLKAAKNTTNVVLPGGGMKLGIGTTNDQQKKILAANNIGAQLDLYDQAVKEGGGSDEDFGGWKEEWSSKLHNKQLSADAILPESLRISPDAAQHLTKRGHVEAILSKITNQDIHDLGGAQITVAEEARLARSLPSVNDPPLIRRAKIKAWREYLNIIQTRGIDALYNGIRNNQIALPGDTPKTQSAAPAPAPAAPAAPPMQQPAQDEDYQSWLEQQ